MTGNQKQHFIVIVDDQHEVRRVLRNAVESMGDEFKVVDTPSAEEAWLVLSSQAVDILVLDVRLPGISGLEFLQRLRSRKPWIKVILITGVADPYVREQAAKARADAFLLKPIGLNDFQRTIEQLLMVGSPKPASQPVINPIIEETIVKNTLLDSLDAFKEKTSVKGVIVLGKGLRIHAKAGPKPEWLSETGWIHSLVLSYRIGIQKLFGDKPPSGESALSLKVPGLELVFFPLSSEYILLMWSEKVGTLETVRDDLIRKSLTEIRLLLRSEPTNSNQNKKAEKVSDSKLVNHEKAVMDPEHLEETLDIDKLFKRADKEKLTTKELNNFWEALASEEDAGYEKETGAISFDEARQMGVAPDGEEETPS
jgi:CheY-like chemotaxis protein